MINRGKAGLLLQFVGTLRPDIFFLIMALMAGLVMVFVTGPLQAPDEPNHFFRAYQISEGWFRGERAGALAGGPIPEAIFKSGTVFKEPAFHRSKKVNRQNVAEFLKTPVVGSRRVFASFPNTVINAPLCYAPQALGISVGRFCGLSVLGIMYAGRLASLICWIAIVFAAIRITPVFKWLIPFLALMPMSIFLAASLSADTMINSCAFLLPAIVLSLRLSVKHSLGHIAFLLVAFLCIALSLMKFVYTPLVGLIFLIPVERWGGRKKMIFFSGSIMALCFLTVALWSLETKRVYIPLYGSFMPEQMNYILANPLKYFVILLKSTAYFSHSFVSTFTGVMGWLDTKLPNWIYYTYTPVLLALAITERSERTKPSCFFLPVRIWLVLCCCFSYLLIATAQYLTMNVVASPLLIGVVGRYFIPLAIPALASISGIITIRQKNILIGVAGVYSICVLVSMVITLYTRYW